jgi:2'-5' RNA ligase
MILFGRLPDQWLKRVNCIYALISHLTIGLDNFNKVHHTAVAIIPPPGLVYDKLMETRRRLGDEDYHKWPPHINLLYPFVERASFKSVIPILQEGLKDVEPFELILSDLGVFGSISHRGIFRGVLWVDPIVRDRPDSLAFLESKLELAMPICREQRLKYGEYRPHMTLSNYNTIEKATEASTELKNCGQRYVLKLRKYLLPKNRVVELR